MAVDISVPFVVGYNPCVEVRLLFFLLEQRYQRADKPQLATVLLIDYFDKTRSGTGPKPRPRPGIISRRSLRTTSCTRPAWSAQVIVRVRPVASRSCHGV